MGIAPPASILSPNFKRLLASPAASLQRVTSVSKIWSSHFMLKIHRVCNLNRTPAKSRRKLFKIISIIMLGSAGPVSKTA
jgi:hypothetical protein